MKRTKRRNNKNKRKNKRKYMKRLDGKYPKKVSDLNPGQKFKYLGKAYRRVRKLQPCFINPLKGWYYQMPDPKDYGDKKPRKFKITYSTGGTYDPVEVKYENGETAFVYIENIAVAL